MKDGEMVGVEDPKNPNHAMSAARYGLTVTRRRLSKNQSR
jgi:hypothetical protein